MIWQQSLSDYTIQALILGQPLFWMFLYESNFQFPHRLINIFYLGSTIFAWIILIKEISIGYYTTFLIIQYIAFTILAISIFNIRYNFKEAVCLGFLVVFLNSFYWELPLHLAEILSGPPHVGMLVQLWRLIPVPFLLSKYRFKQNAKPILELGLGFSGIIMISKFLLKLSLPWIYVYVLNRLVCLLLLIKVIMEATPNSLNIIKYNKLVDKQVIKR